MEILAIPLFYIAYKIWQGYKEQDQKDKFEHENKKLQEQMHREEQEFIQLYLEDTEQYLPVLLRKKQQLVTEDDYGNPQITKFLDEINYFITSTLKLDISSDITSKLKGAIIDKILEYELKVLDNEKINLFFDKDMSPVEYEHFCKNILLENGWNAKVTQQSGDQGVDIIAESQERKIAIQCKLYSSPVGNKAVQEVYAAKQYIGANYAVVVTNNTYTLSAKELANTTNVLLLHHDDLRDFNQTISDAITKGKICLQ